MELVSLNDVLSAIRSLSVRLKVGLWLMPLTYLGEERIEAARLQIDAADLRQCLLAGLPEKAQFAGLTANAVLEGLDGIATESGNSDCVLVYNVDLPLACIPAAERRLVWQRAHIAMPYRPRALLLAVPATAHDVLPPADELDQWGREKRLAGSVI